MTCVGVSYSILIYVLTPTVMGSSTVPCLAVMFARLGWFCFI
jgi:hypothetical protein